MWFLRIAEELSVDDSPFELSPPPTYSRMSYFVERSPFLRLRAVLCV